MRVLHPHFQRNRKMFTLELFVWKKPSSCLTQPGPVLAKQPVQLSCAYSSLMFTLHFIGSTVLQETYRTCHRAWSVLFSCVQTTWPQVKANIVFSYALPTSRGRSGCFTNHTISSLLLLTLLTFSLPHTHAYVQVSATCSDGFSLVWIKASSTSFNRFAQMEGLRGEIMLVRRGFSALSM